MVSFKEIIEFELLQIGDVKIQTVTIIAILLTFIVIRLALWLIRKTLFRKQRKSILDTGNTYALYQIIKYILRVVAISIVLETIGVDVTLLIAGSAALLVGVVLGLQQTFNDGCSLLAIRFYTLVMKRYHCCNCYLFANFTMHNQKQVSRRIEYEFKRKIKRYQ